MATNQDYSDNGQFQIAHDISPKPPGVFRSSDLPGSAKKKGQKGFDFSEAYEDGVKPQVLSFDTNYPDDGRRISPNALAIIQEKPKKPFIRARNSLANTGSKRRPPVGKYSFSPSKGEVIMGQARSRLDMRLSNGSVSQLQTFDGSVL